MSSLRLPALWMFAFEFCGGTPKSLLPSNTLNLPNLSVNSLNIVLIKLITLKKFLMNNPAIANNNTPEKNLIKPIKNVLVINGIYLLPKTTVLKSKPCVKNDSN